MAELQASVVYAGFDQFPDPLVQRLWVEFLSVLSVFLVSLLIRRQVVRELIRYHDFPFRKCG
jgi:hypothetical protein